MNALPLILVLTVVAGVEGGRDEGSNLQGIMNHDHGSCQTGVADDVAVDGAADPLAALHPSALAQVQDALLTDQQFAAHCTDDCGKFWAGDADKFPKGLPYIGDMLLANCMTKANEKAGQTVRLAFRLLQNKFNGAPPIKISESPPISISVDVDEMFVVAQGLIGTHGQELAREWFSRALLTYTVFEYHKSHSLFITDYVNRKFSDKIQALFPGETLVCRLFATTAIGQAPPKNLLMREGGLIGVALAVDEPDFDYSERVVTGQMNRMLQDMKNLPMC